MSVPIGAQRSERSLLLAYLLWFFLGSFGVHRFYLGHAKSGAWMLGLCIVSTILSLVAIGGFGFIVLGIWWLVDAFLIPGLARSAG